MATKEQLRTTLIQEHGHTEETLVDMNKHDLENTLALEEKIDIDDDVDMDVLDNVEVDIEEPPTTNDIGKPSIRSPEWNQYVLEQFEDHELVDNLYPNVDGLRRIVEVLIGEVVISRTTILQVPEPSNEGRATATVEVMLVDEFGNQKIFCGSADCYPGNTKKYSEHTVAMAETRAEARALRRALRLKNPAAEELDGKLEAKDNDISLEEKIQEVQLNGLDVMAKRCNVSIKAVMESFYTDEKITSKTVKGLTRGDGVVLINYVSGHQGNKDGVPEDFQGYEDWR